VTRCCECGPTRCWLTDSHWRSTDGHQQQGSQLTCVSTVCVVFVFQAQFHSQPRPLTRVPSPIVLPFRARDCLPLSLLRCRRRHQLQRVRLPSNQLRHRLRQMRPLSRRDLQKQLQAGRRPLLVLAPKVQLLLRRQMPLPQLKCLPLVVLHPLLPLLLSAVRIPPSPLTPFTL
jgi:hypothetical protein